jgi:hypothetical protein
MDGTIASLLNTILAWNGRKTTPRDELVDHAVVERREALPHFCG